jgi:hypothetical protein
MRYWGLSHIVSSPALPPAYAAELRDFYYAPPSRAAYYAALGVCKDLPAVEAPNIVIVESIGAPNRRMFIDYPTLTEWLRLERTAVMEHDGYTFMLMDALH